VRSDPRAVIVGGMVATPARARPFYTAAQWAIAADGRLAIVHPEPYKVDFVGVGGERVAGVPISFDRVRVSAAHKQQWRDERARPVQATFLTRSGDRAVGLVNPRVVEPRDWPEYLPPFLWGAVH